MQLQLLEMTPNSQRVAWLAMQMLQRRGSVNLVGLQEELEAAGVESWGSTPCHLTSALLHAWSSGGEVREIFRHIQFQICVHDILKIDLERLRNICRAAGGFFLLTPESFWSIPAPISLSALDRLEVNETVQMKTQAILDVGAELQQLISAQPDIQNLPRIFEPQCAQISCFITCDFIVLTHLILYTCAVPFFTEAVKDLVRQIGEEAEWTRNIFMAALRGKTTC
jgi:hypothetical protein